MAAGNDLKVVQASLGHSSIVLTANTYTSVLPCLAHQAAEATVALIRHAGLTVAESHLRLRRPMSLAARAGQRAQPIGYHGEGGRLTFAACLDMLLQTDEFYAMVAVGVPAALGDRRRDCHLHGASDKSVLVVDRMCSAGESVVPARRGLEEGRRGVAI